MAAKNGVQVSCASVTIGPTKKQRQSHTHTNKVEENVNSFAHDSKTFELCA